MNTIVIARYTEDLDWVLDVPEDFKVIIYNKGPQITSAAVRAKAEIVERPNRGRESETYLWHMLNNAEATSGFTVFSQGDPITHSPDFIELLRHWQKWEDLQCLTWQWRADKEIPPPLMLGEYRKQLGGHLRVRLERYSLTTWNPLDFFDSGAYCIGRDYFQAHDLPIGTNVASHFYGMCGLETLSRKAAEHRVGVFSYGAIYGVRNELVRRLGRQPATMLYQASISHPVYGYVLERSWHHLFGASFELPIADPHLVGSVWSPEFCFGPLVQAQTIAA